LLHIAPHAQRIRARASANEQEVSRKLAPAAPARKIGKDIVVDRGSPAASCESECAGPCPVCPQLCGIFRISPGWPEPINLLGCALRWALCCKVAALFRAGNA